MFPSAQGRGARPHVTWPCNSCYAGVALIIYSIAARVDTAGCVFWFTRHYLATPYAVVHRGPTDARSANIPAWSSLRASANGDFVVPRSIGDTEPFLSLRFVASDFRQNSKCCASAVLRQFAFKPWLQLRFDCDTTTIRLRRIARACFHLTRLDASKKLT